MKKELLAYLGAVSNEVVRAETRVAHVLRGRTFLGLFLDPAELAQVLGEVADAVGQADVVQNPGTTCPTARLVIMVLVLLLLLLLLVGRRTL